MEYTKIVQSSFPANHSKDCAKIAGILPVQHLTFHLSSVDFVAIRGEKTNIPSRIYFPEVNPNTISSLTPIQYSMLCCLYTRHHNGFVRQKYAEKCITLTDPWIPPYILQLLGEYVLEIIVMIQQHSNQILTPLHFNFIKENPDFIRRTTKRIVSYGIVIIVINFRIFGIIPDLSLPTS
jgi:hypothetical protein